MSLVNFIKKDFYSEFRSKQSFFAITFITFFITILESFALNNISLSLQMKPLLLCIMLFVTGFLSSILVYEKLTQSDFALRAIDRIVLVKGGILNFYLSKVIFGFSLQLYAYLISGVVLHLMLNVGLEFLLNCFLVFSFLSLSSSALLSLLIGISLQSKLGNLLLILLAIPLLLPVFCFSVNLGLNLYETGILNYSSFSFKFLIASAGIFLLLGINLCESVYRN